MIEFKHALWDQSHSGPLEYVSSLPLRASDLTTYGKYIIVIALWFVYDYWIYDEFVIGITLMISCTESISWYRNSPNNLDDIGGCFS